MMVEGSWRSMARQRNLCCCAVSSLRTRLKARAQLDGGHSIAPLEDWVVAGVELAELGDVTSTAAHAPLEARGRPLAQQQLQKAQLEGGAGAQ